MPRDANFGPGRNRRRWGGGGGGGRAPARAAPAGNGRAECPHGKKDRASFPSVAFANLLPGLPPAPLHGGNNERRRKTARAVNREFLTTFAIAAPQGPYLFRNRPAMPVSQSHVCFSGTIISTLEKLVATIKRF